MDYLFFSNNTVLIFETVSLCLCLILVLLYVFSNTCYNLLKQHSTLFPILLALFFIWLLGIRVHRIDSFMYIFGYIHNDMRNAATFDWHREWFWSLIASICQQFRLKGEVWLAIIGAGYIGFTFITCKKLLWENTFMAFVFFITSFSFISYGVNTLRQGFACSMLLLGMSFLYKNKSWIICLLLCFLAFSTHRSTSIAIVSLILANTLIKKPKTAILIWVTSVVISLVMGNFLSGFIGSFNFDDRIDTYSTGAYSIYRTGFRWDFLLYSAAPILLFWYVSIKRGIQDEIFNKICITYILANAIWVQFIRIAYTDRFAYLSWYMLPLVLAYASIRVPIWKDQDRKAAGILALEGLFTFVMAFVI